MDKSIIFSRESGFYDDEFTLTISQNGGGAVYYTLDGSMPDPNNEKTTYKYEDGILIKDATDNKNVFSLIKDISAGYYHFSEIANRCDYLIPEFNIDKCNVITAKAFFENGEESDTYTKVFFVGMKRRESISNVNVLSISTVSENLFDYEKGIYILGKSFYDDPKFYLNYWHIPINANFRNKGKEWERKAEMCFFDISGNKILSQTGGIRIHGGASRGFAGKSLNLYAREEYDGNKRFKYDFFGTGYEAKKMTLSNGGNDFVSKSSDYLINAACQNDENYAVLSSVPYALFLNGEYWGMYFLQEKYDDKYIEEKYGVKDDDVVIVKNGSIEEGNEEDIELYNEMRSFIGSHDMEDESNYNTARELIDIDSFIHYYATEIYVGNTDWPGANIALWRSRDRKDGLYKDGRWRWLLFDVNSSTTNKTDYDNILYTVNKDPVFRSLMRNNSFREQFASVLSEIGIQCFGSENMDGIIDEFENNYLISLEASFDRFYGKEKSSGIHNRLLKTKQFFNNRYKYITGYMNKYLEDPDLLLKKTVSFDSQGGSAIDSYKEYTGFVLPAPINPVWKGHVFEGWYKDAEYKRKWNFGADRIEEDITLYAKWSLEKYTISFYLGGGSGSIDPVIISYGAFLNTPGVPEWTGHKFKGWFKDSDRKESWDFVKDVVEGNMTLYAGWEIDNSGEEKKKNDESDKPDTSEPPVIVSTPRVPLSNGAEFAGDNDNFAPIVDAGKVKKLKLDFSKVDGSSVNSDNLIMTVVYGSVLKTVDKVDSVISTEKKLKVKLSKKTGVAKVTANKSGSVTFNMQDGKSYTLFITVEKPKAVKTARNIAIDSENNTTLGISDLFGTSINAGTLKIDKEKTLGQAEIKDNRLIVYPRSKDEIRVQYSYLDKRYKIKIIVG